jgi:membrane-associated phospholipid phosphatase
MSEEAKTMREKFQLIGLLCFLLSIPGLMWVYPYINTPYRGVHSLITSVDKAIPFIKIFVIPYAAWVVYIFLTLIYLCFKNRALAFKTILVFDIGLIICFITYYFFQTQGPVRPILTGNDWLSRILQYIHSIDQPYNSFPSIHVMSSYLLIRAFRNQSWKNRWQQWFIGGFSTSIILATLFIKQHMVMDVVGAILLVEFIFKGVDIMYKWVFIQNRKLKDAAKHPGSYTV